MTYLEDNPINVVVDTIDENLDVKYQYDDGVYVVDGDMVFL